jgi:hypothetical protein
MLSTLLALLRNQGLLGENTVLCRKNRSARNSLLHPQKRKIGNIVVSTVAYPLTLLDLNTVQSRIS